MGQIEDRQHDQPIVGWRYWQLDAGPGPQLRSLSQRGFFWPPGRVMVARCADGSARAGGADGSARAGGADGSARARSADVLGESHEAPHATCGCGIHASDDLASLQDQALCLRPVPLVVGEVALWGRVIIEEETDRRGQDLRGQFASPLRLSVVVETLTGTSPAQAVEGLGAYGVAVGTMDLEEAVGQASRTIMECLAMSART